MAVSWRHAEGRLPAVPVGDHGHSPRRHDAASGCGRRRRGGALPVVRRAGPAHPRPLRPLAPRSALARLCRAPRGHGAAVLLRPPGLSAQDVRRRLRHGAQASTPLCRRRAALPPGDQPHARCPSRRSTRRTLRRVRQPRHAVAARACDDGASGAHAAHPGRGGPRAPPGLSLRHALGRSGYPPADRAAGRTRRGDAGHLAAGAPGHRDHCARSCRGLRRNVD